MFVCVSFFFSLFFKHLLNLLFYSVQVTVLCFTGLWDNFLWGTIKLELKLKLFISYYVILSYHKQIWSQIIQLIV